jgi:hypothetical protein
MRLISSWARPVAVIVAGVTLVTLGVTGAAGAAGIGARDSLGPAPSRSGPAARGSVGGRLYAVSAVSSRNVWAVGLQPNNSLIMHWSGSRTTPYEWRVSFTRPVGFFSGVDARSAGDVWAVGGTDWFSSQTLAEHWNGKTWTRVPTPSLAGGGFFDAVAATSASNAWAVGLIGPGPGQPSSTIPLIEHWNGKAWRRVRFPEPAAGGQFAAVAASSASNVWAVGHTGATSEGDGQTTLIEHWNGKHWSVVPSPSPADVFSYLDGVAVTGPDNAWADGVTNAGTVDSSLIEHWNGKRWSVVPSPNPTGDTNLLSIAASRTDAWAVGYTNPTSCNPQCGTAAFHWDGKTWSVTVSVDPPGSFLDVLEGVVVISAHTAWAVGAYNAWSSTLIELWNGTTWVWRLPK